MCLKLWKETWVVYLSDLGTALVKLTCNGVGFFLENLFPYLPYFNGPKVKPLRKTYYSIVYLRLKDVSKQLL